MRAQYQMEFIGGITIENLDPVGYKVAINLDHSENPIILMADLPDEEFMDFIKEELRSRKLHRVKYYKTVKLPPQQTPLCYDRQRVNR